MSCRALSEEIVERNILSSPTKVSDYLKLKLGQLSREVFMVLFVDAQHRMIADDILFSGTLTQTSVYPREVVKRALHYNAASVIFAHNHPSGEVAPSQAVQALTITLKNALNLVDVSVIDRIVIGGGINYFLSRIMEC